MAYPQQTFPNFNALLTYINTYWVTNGNYEITGVKGNNVVNGLLAFIEQSPLNYQKTAIVSSTGVVIISRPVTVFTGTPSQLSWGDSIYNELVLINTTQNAIPLVSGFFYRDIDLAVVDHIPAKRAIVLYKTSNNEWIQGVTYNSSPGTVYTPDELEFEVGDGNPDGMIVDQTQLTVFSTNTAPKSLQIFLDSSFLYKNRVDRISYTVVINPFNFIVTFNQGAQSGQMYNLNWGKKI